MADVTISGLTPSVAVSLTDVLPISNGSITNKAAVSQVLSLLNNSYLIDYLIVAGGGSGGNAYYSAGGGAGGVIYGTTYIDPGRRYPLIVGAGAIAVLLVAGSNGELSYDGGDSYFLGARAIGGGGGGSGSTATFNRGRFGGSGGGHSGYRTSIAGEDNPYYSSYVIGQGHGGAVGSTYGGGGGGGADGFGFTGTTTNGGAGGPGFTWFNGVTYGGGGGGGSYGGPGGLGGAGGGGNGANASTAPSSGIANTGGGGGGASGFSGTNFTGGNGGSGIIIIRYFSDTQKGSGGTVTSSGGYFYHSFTTTGQGIYIG